uniref:Anion exchange protein 2 isoform X1 n=1 Tax=Sus scrofa TaxID=9823 RepID=A0A480F1H6_PIG
MCLGCNPKKIFFFNGLNASVFGAFDCFSFVCSCSFSHTSSDVLVYITRLWMPYVRSRLCFILVTHLDSVRDWFSALIRWAASRHDSRDGVAPSQCVGFLGAQEFREASMLCMAETPASSCLLQPPGISLLLTAPLVLSSVKLCRLVFGTHCLAEHW